jgi:hypothetical protein
MTYMTVTSYRMICNQHWLLELICDQHWLWEHDLLQAVVMGTVSVTSTGYRNMICDKQWLWDHDLLALKCVIPIVCVTNGYGYVVKNTTMYV